MKTASASELEFFVFLARHGSLSAAARALGVDPADCVAIEDSRTGVASALGAGCATLGVPHVVPIAAAPGLTLVDSLVGTGVADLRGLRA